MYSTSMITGICTCYFLERFRSYLLFLNTSLAHLYYSLQFTRCSCADITVNTTLVYTSSNGFRLYNRRLTSLTLSSSYNTSVFLYIQNLCSHLTTT